jgi:hypothetical protein
LDSTEPIIAYVTNQKSEIIAKSLIHSWYNQLFSIDQPYRMKCQLEINVEYFNSIIGIRLSLTPRTGSRTPSIISSINSTKMRKTTAILDLQKPCLQLRNHNGNDRRYSNTEVNQIELPFPWSWTNSKLLNERMNKASKVFSIINQTDSNKTAEIRIYSTMSDRTARLRVQRHRMVLEQLKGEFPNYDNKAV